MQALVRNFHTLEVLLLLHISKHTWVSYISTTVQCNCSVVVEYIIIVGGVVMSVGVVTHVGVAMHACVRDYEFWDEWPCQ